MTEPGETNVRSAGARRARRTFSVTAASHGTAEPPRPTIAVIGGGFTGTLLALHLLRRCRSARVLLIERNRQFGRGLAYSTGNDSHLLNVPAGRMSAFHDQPTDFFDWLTRDGAEEGASVTPMSFVPRRLFGEYIRSLLNQELKSGDASRLDLLRGQVVDIRETDRLCLALEDGTEVAAHLAVVAVGNFPPEPPRVADPWVYETAYYRGDPWAFDALDGLDRDSSVLLIGTGLTMVDTAVSLLDAGHRGPIHALSRRGLLPRRHEAGGKQPDLALGPFPAAVHALTRAVRDEIERQQDEGVNWRAVIDGLRPVTQELWLAWTVEEKSRFLRHLRPWWEVHRHRIAPGIAERLEEVRQSGQLRVSAGRVRSFEAVPEGVKVVFRPSRTSILETIDAARIVNCSGPAADFERVGNQLIQRLLRSGQIRPDPLRLGLDVTLKGALRTRDGSISRRLYAAGPLTKALYWELTSVPDIRGQCELLATHLAQMVALHHFPRLDG